MSWIDVGAIEDIPVRAGRLIRTKGGCVAVFRTGEAEIYATSNTCLHRGGPLAEGIVHDRKVTCPLHDWVYSLETGEVVGGDGAIETYSVKIEDGRILLDETAVKARTAA